MRLKFVSENENMQRDLKSKDVEIRRLKEEIDNKTMPLQLELDQSKAQLTSKENELTRLKQQLSNATQDSQSANKAMQDATKILNDQNEQLRKELSDLKTKQQQEQFAFESKLAQITAMQASTGQVAELSQKIAKLEQDKAMKELASKALMD